MTVLALTPQERDRFASWLEVEAKADRLLALELAKLPGLAGLATSHAKKDAADAKALVARELRETHSVAQ